MVLRLANEVLMGLHTANGGFPMAICLTTMVQQLLVTEQARL